MFRFVLLSENRCNILIGTTRLSANILNKQKLFKFTNRFLSANTNEIKERTQTLKNEQNLSSDVSLTVLRGYMRIITITIHIPSTSL